MFKENLNPQTHSHSSVQGRVTKHTREHLKKHRFKKQAMSGSASPSSESPSVHKKNYLKQTEKIESANIIHLY